jgi:mannose-1-phosphate guanylyltransferase
VFVLQAIILVGGLGTRLRPLTYAIPKPLLPILGKAMVDRVIDLLPPDIDKLVLAVSYKSEELEKHVRSSDYGFEVKIEVEDEPLGTGGAIKNSEDHIDGRFIVFNGDVICSLDTRRMIEFHDKKGGLGSISLWEVDDPSRYGVVDLDTRKRIGRFIEKPPREEAPSNLINAGTYVLETDIFDYMEPGRKISIEREVFPLAIEKGLYGFEFTGFWVDAGTPESYFEAHRALMDHGSLEEKGTLAKGQDSTIVDPVFTGFESSAGERVRVGPYTALGDSVSIGSDSIVEESILLDDVVIGNGCMLKRTIIGPGSRIGSGVHLEDVLVGEKQTVEDDRKERGTKIG